MKATQNLYMLKFRCETYNDLHKTQKHALYSQQTLIQLTHAKPDKLETLGVPILGSLLINLCEMLMPGEPEGTHRRVGCMGSCLGTGPLPNLAQLDGPKIRCLLHHHSLLQ